MQRIGKCPECNSYNIWFNENVPCMVCGKNMGYDFEFEPKEERVMYQLPTPLELALQ